MWKIRKNFRWMWKQAVVVLLKAICLILDRFGETSKNLRTIRSFTDLGTLFRLC